MPTKARVLIMDAPHHPIQKNYSTSLSQSFIVETASGTIELVSRFVRTNPDVVVFNNALPQEDDRKAFDFMISTGHSPVVLISEEGEVMQIIREQGAEATRLTGSSDLTEILQTLTKERTGLDTSH